MSPSRVPLYPSSARRLSPPRPLRLSTQRARRELAHDRDDFVDLLLGVVVVRREPYTVLDALIREVVQSVLAKRDRAVDAASTQLANDPLAARAVDRKGHDRAELRPAVEHPHAIERSQALAQPARQRERPSRNRREPDVEGIARRRSGTEQPGVGELPVLEACRSRDGSVLLG